MICGKCGADISESAKFCPKCGEKNEAGSAPASDVRRCPQCGTENPATARFCKQDGYDLTGPAPGTGQETTSSGEEKSLVCPRCGERNPASAKFCKNDGTPLFIEELYDARKGDAPSWPEPTFPTASPLPDKRSNNWILPAAAALVVVLCAVAGFLYYAGYIGMTPSRAQKVVNESLKTKGFQVTATVDSAWIATLSGTVRDEQERQSAIQVVRANTRIKDVVDNMAGGPDPSNIKGILAQVAGSMATLRTAVTTYYGQKGTVAEASEKPAISAIYGVDLPDRNAQFSVGPMGAITAVIRDVAVVVNGQSITLTPDKDMKVWTWNSQIDRAYLPEWPADSAPAPQTASTPAAPATPPRAVAPTISPAALQAKINKELFNSGFDDVRIVVTGAMHGILKGWVATSRERARALSIARAHRELTGIGNQIEVLGEEEEEEGDWPPKRLRKALDRAIEKLPRQ